MKWSSSKALPVTSFTSLRMEDWMCLSTRKDRCLIWKRETDRGWAKRLQSVPRGARLGS